MRVGYKRTEVGLVPEDWEVPKLGTHATFKTGPFGSALHHSDYVEGGVPVINPMQIVDGTLRPTPSVAITEQAARKLAEFRLSAGNVVIGRRGVMGRCAFVRAAEQGWLCGTGSMIIRTGPSLDARFLQRVLSSPPVVAAIESASVGSTMINLNQGTLGNLRVPFPPKAEQVAIAEALSDADALIGSLSQLLTKKLQLKKGAMQELLTGTKRLPGFSGRWALRPLVELVRTGKFAIVDGPFGTQMKVDEYVPEGVPVIEMEHLNDSVITQRLDRYITPRKFEQLKRSAVYPGDIVISKTGSLGHLGVVPDSVERGIITSRLAKISLNPARADAAFVFQYLLRLRTDGYWESVSQGGTMQILGIRMLQNAPIPDISVPEQAAIAGVLSDMDAEIGALETKLVKARQLKQGMMQELLTGRSRLT